MRILIAIFRPIVTTVLSALTAIIIRFIIFYLLLSIPIYTIIVGNIYFISPPLFYRKSFKLITVLIDIKYFLRVSSSYK